MHPPPPAPCSAARNMGVKPITDAGLPPGWMALYDEDSGKKYYWCGRQWRYHAHMPQGCACMGACMLWRQQRRHRSHPRLA